MNHYSLSDNVQSNFEANVVSCPMGAGFYSYVKWPERGPSYSPPLAQIKKIYLKQ
jgi:hypothetical protein